MLRRTITSSIFRNIVVNQNNIRSSSSFITYNNINQRLFSSSSSSSSTKKPVSNNESTLTSTSTTTTTTTTDVKSTTTTTATTPIINNSNTASSTNKFYHIPTEGNIPSSILMDKIGRELHHLRGHPLSLIKKKIQYHFGTELSTETTPFKFFDNFDPKVTVKENFDDLLFPEDHVGRSPNDTYYFNEKQLLRTHTSAHQCSLLRSGESAFLVTGDVYRRDTIDSVHYPAFHQMEGVRIFEDQTPSPFYNHSLDYYTDKDYANDPKTKQVEKNLKESLESMIRHVINDPNLQIRWIDAYFPFTAPSWEMEIYFQGEWLEVLGCGVIHPKIMHDCGRGSERGWAFGIGLERMAMILFDIPDIRLFWSRDERFLSQFEGIDTSKRVDPLVDIDLKGLKFQPYSKFPSCFKDITFWAPDQINFHENTFFEFVREICGELVEKVELKDKFVKDKRTSLCFRIHYRSMERNLTNQEIDAIQFKLRNLVHKLGVILR
eukprot:gene1501-1893_t